MVKSKPSVGETSADFDLVGIWSHRETQRRLSRRSFVSHPPEV